MGNPLRVLIVEDSEDDALFVTRELIKGGYETVSERVETAVAMKDAIDRASWDLILCDYNMPHFSGLEALALYREWGGDIPFIVVSGTIGEEVAVKTMKAGAHDYVMKDNLIRLAPAVEREIKDAAVRRERRQVTERQAVLNKILSILNDPQEGVDSIRPILALLKDHTGVEATAIRLQKNEDFPYCEVSGFLDDFIKTENSLRVRSASGTVLRDIQGNMKLACMCGNVLTGRTDPSRSYFTEYGSFWTNNASALLASISDEERQQWTRRKCFQSGYESLALIPLKSGGVVIGLLQLSDTRTDCLSLDLVHFLEVAGKSIAIGIHREQTTKSLRESQAMLSDACHLAKLGSWSWHADTKVLVWSEELYRIFRLDPKSMFSIGAQHYHLYAPGEWDRHKKFNRQTMETGEIYKQEFELILPEDERRWIYACGSPIYNATGQITGLQGTVQDITDRKQAEAVLQEKQTRIREAYHLAKMGAWSWTKKTNVLEWSEEVYEMLGLDPSLPVPSMEEHAHRLYASGSWDERLKANRRTLKTGEPYQMEVQMFHADGTRRFINTYCGPKYDADGEIIGLYGTMQDITDRKKSEEALREKQKRIEEAYHLAKMGAWSWMKEKDVLEWSEEIYEMFGFDPRLPPPDIEEHARLYAPGYWEKRMKANLRTLETGEPYQMEVEMFHADGSRRWLNAYCGPKYDAEGKIIGLYGTTQDITDRKQAEEQLKHAYLVLQETNEQLIQAGKLAAVGTLAAGVAHEILNPLNIISVGIAALKTSQELPAPVAEAFDIFQRQVDRVVRITRDLQQFSRKSVQKTEVTDLRELMQETLTLCEPRVKVEGLRLKMDYDDSIPEVSLDRQRISQVFLNILNNAMDAMENVAHKEVCIQIKNMQDTGGKVNQVLVAISDRGTGISETDMNRLFDPFFTTKAVGKGTGLGLSISHSIVQGHGGRIWAENNPEGGATFFVELPVKSDQDA